jgi:hypothetical protein
MDWNSSSIQISPNEKGENVFTSWTIIGPIENILLELIYWQSISLTFLSVFINFHIFTNLHIIYYAFQYN